jgi:PKD repeat protein
MRLLCLLVSHVSRPSLAVIGVLLLATFGSACDKVPLLAPTESTITLNVSTTTVPVSGTAQVIASVTEKPGTPVQNGTVVTFTSSFGTVEPAEARTEGGKVTVTFRAGTQSGTAVIGAFSGATRSETVEVKVGGAAAATVSLRSRVIGVGVAELTATVLDESGNLLPGVPVTFSTTAGQLNPGQAVTDSNGEARSTLSTSREATVTAQAGGKTSNTVTVSATGPSVTITPPTTAIEAGIPAAFRIAPATGTVLRDVVVDWGDNTTPTRVASLAAETQVVHTFARAGVYTVTVTATDAQGITAPSVIIVNVVEQSTVSVILTATPNPVSVATNQGLVAFTATTGGGLGGGTTVSSFTWDFGDGQGATTTGGSTNHRYSAPGNYIATVVARAQNGTQGSNQVTVRVTP